MTEWRSNKRFKPEYLFIQQIDQRLLGMAIDLCNGGKPDDPYVKGQADLLLTHSPNLHSTGREDRKALLIKHLIRPSAAYVNDTPVTVVETNKGDDDDGNPVTCYDVMRGDEVLASLQVTVNDVGIWAGSLPLRVIRNI